MALSGNCRTNPKDQSSVYYTRHSTLVGTPNSLLGKIFSAKKDASNDLARDPKGRYFIDRDGFYSVMCWTTSGINKWSSQTTSRRKGDSGKRQSTSSCRDLVKLLTLRISNKSDDYFHSDYEDGSQGSDHRQCPPPSLVPADRKSGFITVGYRGSCTMGRESQSDAKFRRVPRILICGRVALAKEVFGETLNESRDPDRTPDRYTSRFYLKFKHLERAFDMLSECGFQMVACNSSVTASFVNQHTEDKIWSSYTEYVFYRGPSRWSSPPCDCCCKNHKGDGEGESGTSFNDLSTSSSESQSEASSPQGTVICGPVSRQQHPHANVQTLDRPLKKGPVAMLQQSEQRRKSDLLRTLTASSRDTSTCKKRQAKEKLTVEEELEKCIQDFRKIKIPERFPERKYMWQADLLRKYRL
uniref:Potassium channel tetramerization domain containing 16b n=1 Tax=Sphaeramia orbicularis TaxID=375764 RepID=A0A673ASS9_9TELE